MPERLYKKLFEPMQIGGIRLKNRIIMPAMATNFAHRDGSVSNRIIKYYEKRAQGGAGLIIVEPACVDYPRGKGLVNQLDISSDDRIDGISNLAGAIQAAGAKAALQIHHAGGLRIIAESLPVAPIAPSATRYRGFDTPQEMTELKIQQLLEQYVDAAQRAVKAGFDAIEYHGAHGYAIAQFISPLTNRRTDNYGGSLENRIRFFSEILVLTRKRLGPDYPIICRIDAEEFIEGGISIQDSCRIAERLEASGASAIHVTVNSTPVSSSREIVSNVPPMGSSPGTWINLAAKIKKSCSIPVIAVGRIHDPDLAEQTLVAGHADLIAVGRQLIADPMWPEKIKQEKPESFRPCICCNTCLREVTRKKSSMICAVNPEAGREDIKVNGIEQSKRTLIIGSGPAGMQAAISASDRGHHVEVWESSQEMGGQLLLAGVPSGKEQIIKLVDYMKSEISRIGVPVCCGMDWTIDDIKKLAPDTIIVAAGSRDGLLNVSGITSDIVTSARKVLAQETKVGNQVVIVGCGALGIEVADFLSALDRNITIVAKASHMAEDLDPMRRRMLLASLQDAGTRILLNTSLVAISEQGAMIAGFEGKTEYIDVDTVILATPPQPNREILKQVVNLAPEVFVIGDAMRPGKILDAVTDGWMVGHRI